MNSRQQSAITPFLLGGVGMKFAAQNKPFRFECEQRRINLRPLQNEGISELADRNWSANLHATANQFPNRICAFPSFLKKGIGQNKLRFAGSVWIDGLEER